MSSANAMTHNWLIHEIYWDSIKKAARLLDGWVLDVGCGDKPYQELITSKCSRYIGVDRRGHQGLGGGADVLADAGNLPFASSSFDSLVCFQVMEHLPDTDRFLLEVFRVLKNQSYAILTTPFMWGVHEAPHDYFRFTAYGLSEVARRNGFHVVSIQPHTGFWATATLRFNCWLNRFGKGPLRFLLLPVWLNQYLAKLLDSIDHEYPYDTAGYTSILWKP
jgi:SAM-dependent methyltransferase